ncbi:MAG: PIN domain-containing protein [Candidatus Poribacteria bacterium]|nr:PIN domain-containing protein [Candidatus Poribacteria bacterium]
MKIYFDTCCLCRLDDSPTHARIRLEAQAVETILQRCLMKQWFWFGSEVLAFEVKNIAIQSKLLQAQSRLNHIYQNVIVNKNEISRAKYLESLGFKRMDALHIACAESINVDVFLTTDDKLIRIAKRCSSELSIHIDNPHEWLQEMNKNDRR